MEEFNNTPPGPPSLTLEQISLIENEYETVDYDSLFIVLNSQSVGDPPRIPYRFDPESREEISLVSDMLNLFGEEKNEILCTIINRHLNEEVVLQAVDLQPLMEVDARCLTISDYDEYVLLNYFNSLDLTLSPYYYEQNINYLPDLINNFIDDIVYILNVDNTENPNQEELNERQLKLNNIQLNTNTLISFLQIDGFTDRLLVDMGWESKIILFLFLMLRTPQEDIHNILMSFINALVSKVNENTDSEKLNDILFEKFIPLSFTELSIIQYIITVQLNNIINDISDVDNNRYEGNKSRESLVIEASNITNLLISFLQIDGFTDRLLVGDWDGRRGSIILSFLFMMILRRDNPQEDVYNILMSFINALVSKVNENTDSEKLNDILFEKIIPLSDNTELSNIIQYITIVQLDNIINDINEIDSNRYEGNKSRESLVIEASNITNLLISFLQLDGFTDRLLDDMTTLPSGNQEPTISLLLDAFDANGVLPQEVDDILEQLLNALNNNGIDYDTIRNNITKQSVLDVFNTIVLLYQRIDYTREDPSINLVYDPSNIVFDPPNIDLPSDSEEDDFEFDITVYTEGDVESGRAGGWREEDKGPSNIQPYTMRHLSDMDISGYTREIGKYYGESNANCGSFDTIESAKQNCDNSRTCLGFSLLDANLTDAYNVRCINNVGVENINPPQDMSDNHIFYKKIYDKTGDDRHPYTRDEVMNINIEGYTRELNTDYDPNSGAREDCGNYSTINAAVEACNSGSCLGFSLWDRSDTPGSNYKVHCIKNTFDPDNPTANRKEGPDDHIFYRKNR